MRKFLRSILALLALGLISTQAAEARPKKVIVVDPPARSIDFCGYAGTTKGVFSREMSVVLAASPGHCGTGAFKVRLITKEKVDEDGDGRPSLYCNYVTVFAAVRPVPKNIHFDGYITCKNFAFRY